MVKFLIKALDDFQPIVQKDSKESLLNIAYLYGEKSEEILELMNILKKGSPGYHSSDFCSNSISYFEDIIDILGNVKVASRQLIDLLIEALNGNLYVRRDAALALGKVGDSSAIRPLVELALENKCSPYADVEAIEMILYRDIRNISTNDLKSIIEMPQTLIGYSGGNFGPFEVDCTEIKKLASEELRRRQK